MCHEKSTVNFLQIVFLCRSFFIQQGERLHLPHQGRRLKTKHIEKMFSKDPVWILFALCYCTLQALWQAFNIILFSLIIHVWKKELHRLIKTKVNAASMGCDGVKCIKRTDLHSVLWVCQKKHGITCASWQILLLYSTVWMVLYACFMRMWNSWMLIFDVQWIMVTNNKRKRQKNEHEQVYRGLECVLRCGDVWICEIPQHRCLGATATMVARVQSINNIDKSNELPGEQGDAVLMVSHWPQHLTLWRPGVINDIQCSAI